jgi:3-(3-hydroxy-phenyl)propionate hydroxylase
VNPATCRSVPIVIVGAGPTGITAATLLAQHGINTLVLERRHGVYAQPRAVHMDDEVFRIINRLGLGDRFAAMSRPSRGLRLLDHRHRVLAEFPRNPARSVHGFPQANMFDQPALEELLRGNLAQHPQVELREHAEVTRLVTGTGRHELSYVCSTDGRRHTVHADYVLGCDGANSIVRQQLNISSQDLRFAQRWLVIDIATSVELGQWEGVHQVCDPDRAATFMRIADTRYRWEFRLLDGESATDFQQDRVALMRLLAPWTHAVDPHELAMIRIAEYTFRAQIAARWRCGNAFLLGDAAHLTPPFIGQGLGAGLRDAMNLSWKLAGVIRQDLPGAVLSSYEEERKPHALSLIRTALLMGHAMTAGGRLGNVARRALIPALTLIPGLKSKITDSATPPLKPSVLIHRPRLARSSLPGALCPNATQQDGHKLDSVLGSGFAIITTHQLSAPQHALIRRRGAHAVITDPATELGRWLRHGHAGAVLVRPDRTVMAATDDPEDLCRRLPHFHPPATQSHFS